MFTRKKYTFFLLLILIGISVFIRFYNLNWGAPFYFHPDERNIASSVSQLSFPGQMNPRFFAYGSLPIYTIYLTGFFLNLFLQLLSPKPYPLNPSFEQAIIISRFYSAFFSTLLIPLLFVIARRLKPTKQSPAELIMRTGLPHSPDLIGIARNDSIGLLAAFLAATSAGFIQFAHFGTFEMWLTFFSLLLFLLCLKILERGGVFLITLLGAVFGILVATKVSHLVLLPTPLLVIMFKEFNKKNLKPDNLDVKSETNSNLQNTNVKKYFGHLKILISKIVSIFDIRYSNLPGNMLLFLMTTILVFFFTNPFVLLDYSSFIGSMRYESEVALGTMKVFYTGEFASAVPVVFQFLNIYPFLINPVLTLLFVPSFFYLLYTSIKTKNYAYILLNIFYIILFFSQAFLYAKWTRYMVPTLPFMYLIISVSLSEIIAKSKSSVLRTPPLVKGVGGIFVFITILFSISYFITAFVREDTRIAAKKYALQYIPPDAPVLSEVYDLGITVFNDSFPGIKLFNFYDLDNSSLESTPDMLAQQLANSGYIILPSQRILKTRLRYPKNYPNGNTFYSALLAQTGGFKKIYGTPCDIFCKITYMGNPVYSFEETANVFDRPTVFIFKKNENL